MEGPARLFTAPLRAGGSLMAIDRGSMGPSNLLNQAFVLPAQGAAASAGSARPVRAPAVARRGGEQARGATTCPCPARWENNAEPGRSPADPALPGRRSQAG